MNMFFVLSLAGMELIFLLADCMVLWFGFVTKTVLKHTSVLAIAEQCLNSIKAFSVSHSAAPESRLRIGKGLGGDTAGTANGN